jgi:diadenosine tetraphosphatase ApaH/serine/threonine PP2A family protein phosphatase
MVGGPRPAEVIDRIREMNWPGVYGNTDEGLWAPHRVSEMLQAPHLQRIRDLSLTHTLPATLEAIGEDRLAWLRTLPLRWSDHDLTVVHAVPDDAWRIVSAAASDEDMERVYAVLGSTRVLYGHIHTPFVRRLAAFTLVNTGAVSQSFDGDPRAAYALVDDDRVEIRRVEYDIEKEIRLLLRSDDPFAPSIAATLRTGRYVPISGTSS